jgi:hypothetical protein
MGKLLTHECFEYRHGEQTTSQPAVGFLLFRHDRNSARIRGFTQPYRRERIDFLVLA